MRGAGREMLDPLGDRLHHPLRVDPEVAGAVKLERVVDRDLALARRVGSEFGTGHLKIGDLVRDHCEFSDLCLSDSIIGNLAGGTRHWMIASRP